MKNNTPIVKHTNLMHKGGGCMAPGFVSQSVGEIGRAKDENKLWSFYKIFRVI